MTRLFGSRCRVVPVEATEGMENAADELVIEIDGVSVPASACRTWSAMLAASPLSPLEKALEELVEAARLCKDRLKILLPITELPESDHPTATRYIVEKTEAALARLDSLTKEPADG